MEKIVQLKSYRKQKKQKKHTGFWKEIFEDVQSIFKIFFSREIVPALLVTIFIIFLITLVCLIVRSVN